MRVDARAAGIKVRPAAGPGTDRRVRAGFMTSARVHAAMERPDLPFVLGIGAAIGVVDGLLTAFVGLTTALELAYWTLCAVVAVALVVARAKRAPFVSLLAMFTFAGIVVGSVQTVFAESYKANYPGPVPEVPVWQFLAFGVAVGALWGALVGGIAWAIVRLRARSGASST